MDSIMIQCFEYVFRQVVVSFGMYFYIKHILKMPKCIFSGFPFELNTMKDKTQAVNINILKLKKLYLVDFFSKILDIVCKAS